MSSRTERRGRGHMVWVSYSGHDEDARIGRLLRMVRHGFYADVATAQEEPGSLTRAFYDRGWSGLTFEPRVGLATRLAARRPRDVTLNSAPATSSLNRRSPIERTVGEALDLFAPADIHLLAIGSGFAQAAILDSFELERHRPWLILAADRSPTQAADRWLRDRGYQPADETGAGALYVAEERADLLEPVAGGAGPDMDQPVETQTAQAQPTTTQPTTIQPTGTQPNGAQPAGSQRFGTLRTVTEPAGVPPAEILRAEAPVPAHRLAEVARECEQLRERLAALETAQARERASLRAALERESHTLARLREEIARGDEDAPLTLADREARELLQARQRLQLATQTLARAQAWLDAIRSSRSWTLTRPLRRGIGRLRHGAAAADIPRDLASSLAEALAAPVAVAPPPTPARPPFLPPPAATGAVAGLEAVHQFHSGSAVGDAITNAMLLTRRLLREMGYRSEIYTEQPPAALAGELRPLEELPRHDGYVLILRHSMGYDRFEQVRTLPARKILLYHNITPPALLARHPYLARYARLGREQLASLRDGASAVLADSDYSTAELRALGFAGAEACTILFDVEALLARAVARERVPPAGSVDQADAPPPFTVLFVGRINESKGQLALLEAYASFRAEFGQPSRLVLVGREDGPRDSYAALLRRRIAELGVSGDVLLTGAVDDDALHGHFARADLYVSLSRHEGFGVPLVEAMAHGVPVLAYPGGAVPYTLGGAATLLDDPQPDAVARGMLACARDPAGRARQAEAQRRVLDRFRLEAQRPALERALAAAGARPPQQAALRGRLAESLRFTVAGHVNGSYSLAQINRTLAASLERARGGHVRLLPVEGAPTLDIAGVPPQEQAAVASLVGRPAHATGPELVLSQHYPVWVPPPGPALRVAILFWEESLLPAATIAVLNREFDAVLAPTGFVRDALLNSGLAIPVRLAALPMRLAPHLALRQRLAPGAGPVRHFLHVSSCFPRKGVDVLLRAWARAFRAGDPVRLTIKGFPNPHNDVPAQLAELRARDPGGAPVELIDADLDEEALLALYARADVVVLPTRGEGLNLPAAEAMAAGIPLILTGAGGHMSFVAEAGRARAGVRLLDWRPAASRSHLATDHSLWLEPDEDDLVAALREAASGPLVRPPPPAAPEADAIAATCEALALDLLLRRSLRRVRISWVSSWNVRCGVGEYSRQLLAARPEEGAQIRVLCDRRTPAVEAEAQSFWPCWELGAPDTLQRLAQAIAADDADAVMIQHQPGLLSFPTLAALLRHRALAGRVVAVTLHNTLHLLDLEADERAAVVEACRSTDLLLVHTLADLHRLQDLGLSGNVRLLPHGVAAPLDALSAPRHLRPETDAPLIGCYGFFLPGKGIDVLIEALALLRRRWPLSRLLLVNAEYGDPVSAAEISRCRALAHEFGVADAVTFETGFLANQDSLARLRQCDVVALPYRPSKEASSAALRGVMTACVPVAVTPVGLFDEAGDSVLRFDDLTASSVAGGLDRLLGDPQLRDTLRHAARRWVGARQWEDIASRLEGMITGLVRTRQID